MMTPRVDVRRVAGPSVEPISLGDARIFLRQDVPGFSGDTMQDSILQSWIRTARVVCEKEIDSSIGPQTFVASLRSFNPFTMGWAGYTFEGHFFPDPTWGLYDGAAGGIAGWRTLRLPRGPVRSVEQIRYRVDGASYAVLDPATYRLTTVTREIELEAGHSWPAAGTAQDSVVIDYTAGLSYPLDSDIGVEHVDEDVITAMRLLLGHFWFNRSAVVQAISRQALMELPLGVKALLWPNRRSIGI